MNAPNTSIEDLEVVGDYSFEVRIDVTALDWFEAFDHFIKELNEWNGPLTVKINGEWRTYGMHNGIPFECRPGIQDDEGVDYGDEEVDA
jgi:hypothetical protein